MVLDEVAHKKERLRLLLLEKEKLTSPDYFLSKEISRLKIDLGIATPKPPLSKAKQQQRNELKKFAKKSVFIKPSLRLNIAFDCSVLKHKHMEKFNKLGFKVVVIAEHGETDDSWISRAVKAKADIAVTDDYQAQYELESHGIKVFNTEAKDSDGVKLYQRINLEFSK